MLFIKQFLKSPFTIGSICPSSKALANALARMALEQPGDQGGLIIDLGTGTGVVTRALLARGFPAQKILAIDICENFRTSFYKNFPQISFLTGDARNLYSLVMDNCPSLPLLAIISSLPLQSLPRETVSLIMDEIWKLLRARGGCLVQYTYAIWLHAFLAKYGFNFQARRYIAHNLPPCVIEKYSIKQKTPA